MSSSSLGITGGGIGFLFSSTRSVCSLSCVLTSDILYHLIFFTLL
ncbi:hypothetical protein LEP1GSC084_1051 [Leptospira interrogans serovar Medanensis str. L0448]|nr:hypothetical protein LEP1GSC099_1423 [Leptospira interrogans str. UI 08452]EMN33162.1 hypothetical protein LEP1GSC084_1051 [Leptospira interrogans serovar Medanensis str. L0448]